MSVAPAWIFSMLEPEPAMADDTNKTGRQDRDRINVNEDYELRDWSRKFGVTTDELKSAVQKVGPMVKDVQQHLGRQSR
jgi:hypothetical protein